MFRTVELPRRVAGKLLLHSMPGRFEKMESVWHQVRSQAVGAIVCLAEAHEIQLKSAEYATALESGTVPCSVVPYAIPEGGVPTDRDLFWEFVNRLAERLVTGDVVLVHCAGGVGRTAMLAVSVLLALGASIDEAEGLVSRAGSKVETMPQMEMLTWCAARASAG